MHGGQIEAINSRIKTIKRMSCDNFGSDDFFFNSFRIKAAFTGNS